MTCAIEARIVAIDAVAVFVATEAHIAAFRRDALPVDWRRTLKQTAVNGSVAALIDRNGVPAETPFEAVPALSWPSDIVSQ